MAEKPIQNCEVRFQFQCPKQWDALAETTEAGVRSCGQCQKRVYLCESTQEVARHAREGHCIAVPRWVTSPRDFPDDPELVQALARQHGVPAIHLRDYELDPDILRLVPREVASQHTLIPVNRAGNTLIVAMSNPANLHAIDDVKFITGYSVEVVVASRQDIEKALDEAESRDSGGMLLGEPIYEEEEEPEPAPSSGPIGKLIGLILTDAHRKKADEIRMEVTDSSLVIRYDLAGTQHEAMRPPLKIGHELLRQLRLESGASPGLEGQLHLQREGQHLHYKVRINPTASGEELVLQPLPEKRGE